MKLALAVGSLDWRAVQRSLTPEEMDEWAAFDHLHPIGLDRLYQVIARVGSQVLAAKGQDVPPESFIPGAELPGPQGMTEQIAQARVIAAGAMGAR
jgi:hypothetical protein